MPNEDNAYEAIERHEFVGQWKRLHGMRGLPDYIVWVPPRFDIYKGRFGRQFFAEVKQLERMPRSRHTTFNLDLRPAQVPFFSKLGGWPGEKYVLVRWGDKKTWSWFSGEDRITSLSREIAGPFKRERPR